MAVKKTPKKSAQGKSAKKPAKKPVARKATPKDRGQKAVAKAAAGKSMTVKTSPAGQEDASPPVGMTEGKAEKIRAAHKLFLTESYGETIDICESILASDPSCPEALHIIGLCSFMFQDQGRAITLIERAHELDPECRDYAVALSYIYTFVGKLTDGLYYAKLSEVLSPHPDFPGLTPAMFSDYGHILRNSGDPAGYLSAYTCFLTRDFEGAIAYCDKELRLHRENVDAYHLLGRALLETKRYARAVAAFHAAIHMNPDSALSLAYLGEALMGLGRHAEGFAVQAEARRRMPDNMEIQSCALRGASFMPDIYKPAIKEAIRNLNTQLSGKKIKKSPRKSERMPGKKIKIGYVSDSFYAGSHTGLIEPFLRYYDRNTFDVYCYSMNPFRDLVTTRFENYVLPWKNIHNFDEAVVAQIIDRDGIDILVDLCFEPERQAMGIFAMGVAPVQISWLGRPEAAGIMGITDYLTDAWCVERDAALALKGQTGHLLKDGLIVLDPLSPHITVDAPPFESEGMVTFGGICDLARLTPEVAGLWASILKVSPYTRLHLGLTPLRDLEAQKLVLDLFSHHGVMDKISFQSVPSNEGKAAESDDYYMEFFQSVDILLDTFPVNCVDVIPWSLWVGIPVVTLKGQRRSGILGASMLSAAGKSAWIAETPEDYLQIVQDLISDPENLRHIRTSLQDEVGKSDLFSPRQHIKNIEAVYARLIGA